jgi:hypothetical protein
MKMSTRAWTACAEKTMSFRTSAFWMNTKRRTANLMLCRCAPTFLPPAQLTLLVRCICSAAISPLQNFTRECQAQTEKLHISLHARLQKWKAFRRFMEV